MMKNNPPLLRKAISIVSDYHFRDGCQFSWRTGNFSDWSIETAERADNNKKKGYAGLRNFGCTCYINSLMQQYFMI